MSRTRMSWCTDACGCGQDGLHAYLADSNAKRAARSAFYSLAMVGTAVTLGVLIVTVSYEYGDGNPREERRLLRVDALRVMQEALEPVQRRT